MTGVGGFVFVALPIALAGGLFQWFWTIRRCHAMGYPAPRRLATLCVGVQVTTTFLAYPIMFGIGS